MRSLSFPASLCQGLGHLVYVTIWRTAPSVQYSVEGISECELTIILVLLLSGFYSCPVHYHTHHKDKRTLIKGQIRSRLTLLVSSLLVETLSLVFQYIPLLFLQELIYLPGLALKNYLQISEGCKERE